MHNVQLSPEQDPGAPWCPQCLVEWMPAAGGCRAWCSPARLSELPPTPRPGGFKPPALTLSQFQRLEV